MIARRVASFSAVALIVLLDGCVVRTSLYAPRMTDTDEHRNAVAAKTCQGCHDPARIRFHKTTDDCASCHRICTGC